MYIQQLKFSSQKMLLSVQNRPLMWFLVLPFAYFSCLEALGLKGTTIPHSPQSRCLSMSVSLNACGEGGKLWDQGPKMWVWASYSFLKHVSYVCSSAAVSALLSAHLHRWTLVLFIPSLLCAIAGKQTTPDGVMSPLQTQDAGGELGHILAVVRIRAPDASNGLDLGSARPITFMGISLAKANFRWWILHLPQRWEDKKRVFAEMTFCLVF